jgi:hypothetical protein
MADPVFTELLSLPEVRVGQCESLMVMVWRGEVTAASLDRSNAIEDELVKRFNHISVMGIITNLVGGIPTSEMRQKSTEAMKRYQANVRGTALVVTATGAKAVLTRTFLAGMTLLIDFESPLKSFRTVNEGLQWLARLPQQDPLMGSVAVATALAKFVDQSRPASAASAA